MACIAAGFRKHQNAEQQSGQKPDDAKGQVGATGPTIAKTNRPKPQQGSQRGHDEDDRLNLSSTVSSEHGGKFKEHDLKHKNQGRGGMCAEKRASFDKVDQAMCHFV
jgi:hypothetical protein